MSEKKATYNLTAEEALLNPVSVMGGMEGIYFTFRSDLGAIADAVPGGHARGIRKARGPDRAVSCQLPAFRTGRGDGDASRKGKIRTSKKEKSQMHLSVFMKRGQREVPV